MNTDTLISQRARSIDASGIRRVFELGRRLKNPINLSIGQPNFPVPDNVKRAAIDAISSNHNGYTVTQGIQPLLDRIALDLEQTLHWPRDRMGKEWGALVTSGTSGALFLAAMALLDRDSEMVIPDPWFVLYPNLARLFGGHAIPCDTYPDFRMTASRVAPLLSANTRFVLACSPGNPTGVTITQDEFNDLHNLCRERNVLLLSDEIYDRFLFPPHTALPTPARVRDDNKAPWRDTLLVRGFGKTYAATGWRIGYVAGPLRIIEEMAKLQQYTYVCAPSMAQWGALAAYDADITPIVNDYAHKRDRVVKRLSPLTELAMPTGAFYAFPKVPDHLNMTATDFAAKAVERSLLVIPGAVFSSRDTHLRLSFAAEDHILDQGLDILAELFAK